MKLEEILYPEAVATFTSKDAIKKRTANCTCLTGGPIEFRVERKMLELITETPAELEKLLHYFCARIVMTANEFHIKAIIPDKPIFIFCEKFRCTSGMHWKGAGFPAGILLNVEHFPDGWHATAIHELVHTFCPAESFGVEHGSLVHELVTESIEMLTMIRMRPDSKDFFYQHWRHPDSYFSREWQASQAEGRASVIKSKDDLPEVVLNRILKRKV